MNYQVSFCPGQRKGGQVTQSNSFLLRSAKATLNFLFASVDVHFGDAVLALHFAAPNELAVAPFDVLHGLQTEGKHTSVSKTEGKHTSVPKTEEKHPSVPKTEEKHTSVPKTEEKHTSVPKTEEKHTSVPKTCLLHCFLIQKNH